MYSVQGVYEMCFNKNSYRVSYNLYPIICCNLFESARSIGTIPVITPAVLFIMFDRPLPFGTGLII